MKFLKNIGVFLVIFIFTFQSISTPIYALSTEEEIKSDNLQTATILLDDHVESVPLYQEDSDTSEVLILIQSEEEVIIFEELEEFTFVEYIEKGDEEETFQGFVLNDYLIFEEDNLVEDLEDKVSDESDSESNSSTNESEENSENQTDIPEEELATEVEDDERLEVEVENTEPPKDILKEELAAEAKDNEGLEVEEESSEGLETEVDEATLDEGTENTIVEEHQTSSMQSTLSSQLTYFGISLKDKTHVYASQSTSSTNLKTYEQGATLKYRAFNANWYEATVMYNGKWTTGYIHKNDVENITNSQTVIQGVALQNTTKIYSKASTGSSTIRSYAQGSILKYKSYTSNWYEATVMYNGKWTKGYIHKSHVENSLTNQTQLQGIGTQNLTTVYANASTSSKKLKSYAQGSILTYKTFSNNWYQATVYINGKATTGYIHKNHVENSINNQETLEGWAAKQPTNVYSNASKSSKVLKGYSKSSSLKFKTFTAQWYEATVYINGKPTIGYIHVDDVHFGFDLNYTNHNLSLDQALAIQMKATPQTDQNYAWVSKTYIDNNKVTASSLHVRSGPGTKNSSLGTISNGTTVKILDEYNGWYAIQYSQKIQQWVHAGPKDVAYYLNPENFVKDEVQMFQFLDLSKASGASETVLNNYLKGKGILEGQAEAFIEAGRHHGLNDVYLISHAILETGHGTSTLAKGVKYNGVTVYNMYGIGAYDSCPVDCGAERAYNEGWTTPTKAIIGGAKFIGNDYVKAGQNTLYKMRWNPVAMELNGSYGKQYATDIGWASKQINTMFNMYKELDSYILYLDIPVYK